jgi:hypothetical protein
MFNIFGSVSVFTVVDMWGWNRRRKRIIEGYRPTTRSQTSGQGIRIPGRDLLKQI